MKKVYQLLAIFLVLFNFNLMADEIRPLDIQVVKSSLSEPFPGSLFLADAKTIQKLKLENAYKSYLAKQKISLEDVNKFFIYFQNNPNKGQAVKEFMLYLNLKKNKSSTQYPLSKMDNNKSFKKYQTRFSSLLFIDNNEKNLKNIQQFTQEYEIEFYGMTYP